MGGIDEAALDRLSLVTEMTKHIRVRASGGRTTASELGQFSPVFVWLLRVMTLVFFVIIVLATSWSTFFCLHLCLHLCCMIVNNPCYLIQDFYLDLVEDNRKITPRDYLELALRPMQGGGRDISAKNEVACFIKFYT